MNGFYVLIGYFVIALIVFAALDYFYGKKNTLDIDGLIFISLFWIFLFIGCIFATPFYVIHKLIKRNNKL